jgi:hypothetical protein
VKNVMCWNGRAMRVWAGLPSSILLCTFGFCTLYNKGRENTHNTHPTMSVKTKDEIIAFVGTLAVGDSVEVKWRTANNAAISTWTGTIQSIAPDKKSANVKYAEAPNPETVYALPPTDTVGITAMTKKASAPEGDYAAGSLDDRVRLYDPVTWTSYIESDNPFLARRLLASELCTFFAITPRDSLPRGAEGAEYDKASFLEVVLNWFDFAASIRSWKKEPVLAIVRPALLRLMDYKAKAERGGARAIRQFRADLEEEVAKGDKVGKAWAKLGKLDTKNDPEAREPTTRGKG